jgi:hypothetical protein
MSGTVPPLEGMQQLTYMHIGGNGGRFGEVGMQGGLEWLGALGALEEVLLWDNEFRGPFPTSMRGSSSLKRLELGHNPLSCDIPEWLGDLPLLGAPQPPRPSTSCFDWNFPYATSVLVTELRSTMMGRRPRGILRLRQRADRAPSSRAGRGDTGVTERGRGRGGGGAWGISVSMELV